MEEVAAAASEKIALFGFTIVAVFGSPTSVPFAYTVGLTVIGEPELMILGSISPEYARITLDNLAQRVVVGGKRYKPGDVPPDVLEGGYEVMICGPLPAVMVEEYPPGVAGMLYGKEKVSVYQVVYQDRNHLYPWQPGYDMPEQPYLSGGRG